ncbi:hypothetical protein [Streptomyces pilosus]|uniref:Uncharacterized protein n=1 Tax=Streptomyces pilosus TaxID=28893 RepID=A0A918ETY2_9ACTN|nr:hypothetical protein [Streptomyces pilosus]GGQ72146.1 hypothetical protein GCM10010280_17980 [Streptomyces pilosus]
MATVAACAVAPPPGTEPTGPDRRPHDAQPPSSGESGAPGDGTARTPSGVGPSPSGPHGSTALRCGPALSSPDGIEAQTCVVAQGDMVRARTYRTYCRNASGEERAVALSLLGPDGRTPLTHCALDTGDEPARCETPRERGTGGFARYTVVAEFADRTPGGRLLLRSGSN